MNNNMEDEGMVKITLVNYNRLLLENRSLSEELKDARNALDEIIRKKDGIRVIREIITHDDVLSRHTKIIGVENFDDVRASVEEYYGKTIEKLIKQLICAERKSNEYKGLLLDAKSQISNLKHRSLWERILNR